MKTKLILLLFLGISTYSFGRKTYTMTRLDFSTQFNENNFLQKVYCQNEKGEKVWLFCNKNSILRIHLKNNKTEDLMLQTIKFKQGVIEAIKYNVWIDTKKVNKFEFDEVEKISIDQKFQEYERPYFNYDSSLSISKQKNDSLRNIYSGGFENIIFLKNKKGNTIDSFQIVENACYNLTHINGAKTEYGVAHKITEDSIYISNYFNQQMAIKKKSSFEIWPFRINDIKEISLLKPGGYSYIKIKLEDYFVSINTRKKKATDCPFWFAVNPTTGEVDFYRLWQTDRNFPGITEKEGNAIWYEGEKKE